MYCSDAQPMGVTMTASDASVMGCGNIFVSAVVGVLVCLFYELPLTRML